jgi:GNAT superfamily N-acetyltransferase
VRVLAKPFQIRPPVPDDTEACLRIANRALPLRATRPRLARLLIAKGANAVRAEWVATIGDRVVAFVSEQTPLRAVDMSSLTVAVDPDFRGLGVGRALADLAAAQFEQLDVATITASIDATDPRSAAFGRHYGFVDHSSNLLVNDLAPQVITDPPAGVTVKRIAAELLTPQLLLAIERLWPEAVEDLRLSEEMARDHPEYGEGQRDEVTESGVVFAAYASDQLVGGVVVTSGAWIPVSFLERMTVARPWRRRGVGLALATRVAEWARNHGKHQLVATIWTRNDAALALALRVGFQSRPVGLMVRKFREPRIS